MYIHSVKLVNFKSIGDYQENEIIIEPNITTIIGMNESGKSNIIEGISNIKLTDRNNRAFNTEFLNRNGSQDSIIKYIITLKPSDSEKNEEIQNNTVISIDKEHCEATGGILSYYKKEIQPDVDSLAPILGEIPKDNPLRLRDNEWEYYKIYYSELLKTDNIDIPIRRKAFAFLLEKANQIEADKQESLKNILKSCQQKWTVLENKLPTIFFCDSEKRLNSRYDYESIKKEFNNPQSVQNSLLNDFVNLIRIPKEDFLTAASSGTQGHQETLRNRINKSIEKYINEPFYDFYKTEKITLNLSFNAGTISFIVQSEDGEALMLSERSNGLRWYLNLFINARAHNIKEKNVVYLFDEPGITLHVNAQRELIKLFKCLAREGNQIVYTTHSPYMIDLEGEGIHTIRAVVKDLQGFTKIYKTPYDYRIFPECQHDTLAPIISAIGMNLKDTFGPAKNKINIVTEGISDYIYLNMMSKILNIDSNKYAIIPSVGAKNCVNICAILRGWGCPFIALFDYDKEGVQSSKIMQKDMLWEYKKEYCFVKEISESEIEDKTYQAEPFMIEDLITRDDLNRFCVSNNVSATTGKPLLAKLISNSVCSGNFSMSEKCKDNFESLFKRIFCYTEKFYLR